MASYHSSFTYLNKNSAEEGFIITSFEPDNGFKDAFLGMDQIYEDYYDGTKKFLYGTKYNTSASVFITLVKVNGTNLTIEDNRRLFRWLTGARTASWLDLYEDGEIKYSFLGTVTNPQQYKLDGRVIGISFEFASISPWAFSAPKRFNPTIKQALDINEEGVLIDNRSEEGEVNNAPFIIDDEGIIRINALNASNEFNINDEGIIYIDTSWIENIDNKSDDLYTYIYFDIDYINGRGDMLSIKNETLNEETIVNNIQDGEVISVSSKQFIISSIPGKIFGDDFNWVWPRLAPGVNKLVISGAGSGSAQFTYRYPMKIGDCAMDVSTYGGDSIYGDCGSGSSYSTVDWNQIINTPTSIGGYGIRDAYTSEQVDEKIEEIDVTASVTIDENELNNMLGEVFGS